MTGLEAEAARSQVTEWVQEGILAINLAPLPTEQDRSLDERPTLGEQQRATNLDPKWSEGLAQAFAKVITDAIQSIPHTAILGDEYENRLDQDDEGRDMESEYGIGTLTRMVDVVNPSEASRREILKLCFQPTRIRRAQRKDAFTNQAWWTRKLHNAVASSLKLFAPESLVAHSATAPNLMVDLQLWRMMQAKGVLDPRQQLIAREWASLCSSAVGDPKTRSNLEPNDEAGKTVFFTDSGFLLYPHGRGRRGLH